MGSGDYNIDTHFDSDVFGLADLNLENPDEEVSLLATSVSFGRQLIPDLPSISFLKDEVSLGKLTVTSSEEAAMGPSNLSSSQITKLPLLFNRYELRIKALEERVNTSHVVKFLSVFGHKLTSGDSTKMIWNQGYKSHAAYADGMKSGGKTSTERRLRKVVEMVRSQINPLISTTYYLSAWFLLTNISNFNYNVNN
jgi:hypothetical protein